MSMDLLYKRYEDAFQLSIETEVFGMYILYIVSVLLPYCCILAQAEFLLQKFETFKKLALN